MTAIHQSVSTQIQAAMIRLAFHSRGFGPHGRVKEWCADSAHHSLTQPCGPKPRQWKAGLMVHDSYNFVKLLG